VPTNPVKISLAAVTVALAALALSPTAFADGWTLQSIKTDSSWVSSALNGVSCPPGVTNNCYAVGDYEVNNSFSALIEHWNGSSWSIVSTSGPAGSSSSGLNSVSCPSVTYCMAVGGYSSGGDVFPLVYTWGNAPGVTLLSFAQQSVPLKPDEQGFLNDVSCQSSTFCVAVGGSGPAGHPIFTSALQEVWKGAGFTEQQGGAGSQNARLNAVSCAPAQSSFCMAVGFVRPLGQGGPALAYVESYDGKTWVAQTNTSDGRFVVQPSNTTDAFLTGVYCLYSAYCQMVGNDYPTGSGREAAWGAELNGGWRLTSPPPSAEDVLFGGLGGNALACPSGCWAVGQYANASANAYQVFADNLDESGTQWAFASLPNPSGTQPLLNTVTCPQIDYCEAVGEYIGSSGKPVAFAEQFTYTPPPGHKCTDPDCPPPRPGTPHHFSLTAHGTERNGATVTALLHKPRALVLLVRGLRHRRPVIVGLVSLGSHPAGTSRIHWNLRVDGRLLRHGTYQVSVHSIASDLLSPDTPPGEITLTVKATGQVHIEK
jgi:hypothetical protein